MTKTKNEPDVAAGDPPVQKAGEEGFDLPSPMLERRANIHFVFQGKGGVGKSTLCSFMAQYLTEKKGAPLCLDCDPANKSLCRFEALNASPINVLDDNKVVVPLAYDALVENILHAQADVIVDNGSSGFLELLRYMVSHDLVAILQSQNKRVFIHTIIMGGPEFIETIDSFGDVCEFFLGKKASGNISDIRTVVWLSSLNGKLAYTPAKDSAPIAFEDSKVYKAHQHHFSAVLLMPEYDPRTHLLNLTDMLSRHLTFNESYADASINFMERTRIQHIKKDYFQLMDQIPDFV